MPKLERAARTSTPVEPITAPRLLRAWWIPDLGFAALRVVAASLLLLPGIQRLFGVLLPPGQAWSGAPRVLTDPWVIAALEFGGGALLLVGLFTCTTAFLMTLFVALSYALDRFADIQWIPGGWEFTVLYCALLLAFAVIGPGLFSIDGLFAIRRAPPRRKGMNVELSPWIEREYRRSNLSR